MKRFRVEQEVNQEAKKFKIVLRALSYDLDGIAKAAKEILQATVAPFCPVYHGHFKGVELEHTTHIGEDIDGTVHFVACDLP